MTHRRPIAAAAVLAGVWLGLAGPSCGGGETPATPPDGSPWIAATTVAPMAWIVEQIAGERVTVEVMVPDGASPHSYEPLPSQLVALTRARAYFAVGSGVEFERTQLDTLRQHNPAMRVVACAEGITLRGWGEPGGEPDHGSAPTHDGHGAQPTDDGHGHGHGARPTDDGHGHGHGARPTDDGHGHGARPTDDGHEHGPTDPHVWLAPAHAQALAGPIRDALVELDPAHADGYERRYEELVTRLGGLDDELRSRLAPFAGRAFLVYHPSWGYFADAYGLRQLAIEEAGRQPGPAGVAAVIEQARGHDIAVVFTAPQFDVSSAAVIADAIGGRVVTADPLAREYEGSLRALADALVDGFGGAASAGGPLQPTGD